MKVYNTFTRRLEEFKPLRGKEVRLYTCGPSVYSPPHLGNFRTYVFEDVLKRVLLFKGYRVRHVMNITDVEDKAVREARGSMARMRAIARSNIGLFMKNSRALNILPADHYPRATDNIPYMVRLIKRLLAKRLAYRDERGNIFFDASRFPGYGRLSHTRFRHPLAGRVLKDDYYQCEAGDWLLWKAWKPSDGDIWWLTSIGKGRPGWHIECSAMATRFLGPRFDIHMGGVDNIFPHHENEIAESKGATGSMPARYWLHVRHLLIEGEKMSKSLGNYYTVDAIHSMGFGFDAIRAHLLSEHYRRRLNFTFRGLRATARELKRCKQCIAALRRRKFWKENPAADSVAKAALAEFNAHLDNDLDIPAAMRCFCLFVRRVQRLIRKKKFGCGNAKTALETLRKMDSVLGLIWKGDNLKSFY
ncbi:MAG: cysteine--tRNA ligase [Candidatus Micrarchaeia archaeon]